MDRLQNVESELRNLPPSFADNPQGHVLGICSSFVRDIENYTNGTPPVSFPSISTPQSFLRDAAVCYSALEKGIKGTRPRFEITPSPPAAFNMLSSDTSQSSHAESGDRTLLPPA